jgi:type I restriction enzyme M protein
VPLELSPQSDLRSPSLYADSWGRYYTHAWVSKQLVSAIESQHPTLILELGSGHGALAEAAAWKWSNSRVITVDIDGAATNHLKRFHHDQPSKHDHYVHDALDDKLPSHIGLLPGTVDVAVCNPPYTRPRWQEKFASILEDAGLSGSLSCIKDAGADLLFIAQNLRLLKNHGKLGLILPDGLITAEKFVGVRKVLLADHSVEQVIQLPRRVFTATEAQTYLLILSKCDGPTSSIVLRRLDANGDASAPLNVQADRAIRRLDYNFHCFAKETHLLGKNNKQRLGSYVQEVVRGSVSSHEIKDYPAPVFHLTNFSVPGAKVPRTFIATKRFVKTKPDSVKMALPGDLLIARVGRNHFSKIASVVHGPCLVSDCVFILRTHPTCRAPLLKYLSSPSGQRALQSIAHGVGARYITTSDLLDIEVPI